MLCGKGRESVQELSWEVCLTLTLEMNLLMRRRTPLQENFSNIVLFIDLFNLLKTYSSVLWSLRKECGAKTPRCGGRIPVQELN